MPGNKKLGPKVMDTVKETKVADQMHYKETKVWPERALTVKEEEEEDDEVCEICWCDPPKFGISTSCTHFFCTECIQGHLKQVLNSGEFPGYCPMCQASAPKGQEPVYVEALMVVAHVSTSADVVGDGCCWFCLLVVVLAVSCCFLPFLAVCCFLELKVREDRRQGDDFSATSWGH